MVVLRLVSWAPNVILSVTGSMSIMFQSISKNTSLLLTCYVRVVSRAINRAISRSLLTCHVRVVQEQLGHANSRSLLTWCMRVVQEQLMHATA